MRCMASLPLWRARALLEERAGAFGRARALLEQARLKNPANDVLWLAAVHSEQRAGNAKAAESLIAKGLQARSSASASLPHACEATACAGCMSATCVFSSVYGNPCPLALSWTACSACGLI